MVWICQKHLSEAVKSHAKRPPVRSEWQPANFAPVARPHRSQLRLRQSEERKVAGNLALGLGIIGCLFFWVPILGVLPDVLALIYGTRVLRQMPKASSRDQLKAITGMVLGSLALVYLGIGFVILFWPRN